MRVQPTVAIPLLALLGAFAACSSSPPAERNPVPKATATAVAIDVPSAQSLPPADSAAPVASASAVASSGPTACPEGMALVDGDYCDEVEHNCLKEWYAKQNNKRVCEVFEKKATCKGKKTKKRYCIDKYEWPNIKGERPEVMNRFHQAQVKCAAAGKRMCSESEWNFACEGPEMKPFPQGYATHASATAIKSGTTPA
jgi:sulfatase modifying factor 1